MLVGFDYDHFVSHTVDKEEEEEEENAVWKGFYVFSW